MKKEIKDNVKYIFFISLISFLTILPQIIVSNTLKHTIALILLALLISITANFSKIFFSILIVYINILNIIKIHTAIHWGSATTLFSSFEIMVRSPISESLEYLHSFIDYRDFLIVSYVIIVFILLFYYLIKHQHNFRLIDKISIVLFIALFSILIKKEPLNSIQEYIEAKNGFLKNNTVLQKRKQYLSNLHLKQNKHFKAKYNKIVIVIGESVNKNFLNQNTSPFLFSLLNNKYAYNFNVIAPFNQTRYSVPMILTMANVSNWINNFTHSESIITDFNSVNYKSYWISNQGHIGSTNDWVTSVGDEANVKKFFNIDHTEAKPDDIIINYLKSLNQNNQNELYIFHLMGSHFEYTLRYGQEHILYKKPKNITQEYENTIYFTDYILKNIFNYFKENKNFLFIYLSDHAEVVNNSKHGHGFLPTFKDEYQIPLFIYSNIQNQRLIELYNKNKKHFFNTENMNYIIKYISYLSDDINISTSANIFSLNPKNKFNYYKLQKFH